MGHLVGTAAGVTFCVPVFYRLFLGGDPQSLISDAYPFPAASIWIGVSQMLTGGLHGIPRSALLTAGGAAALSVLLTLPMLRLQRLGLSPIGIGLAFLIPFHISLAIFTGGFLFWLIELSARQGSYPIKASIRSGQEVICAGLMTGTALTGIFVLAWEAWLMSS